MLCTELAYFCVEFKFQYMEKPQYFIFFRETNENELMAQYKIYLRCFEFLVYNFF